MQQANQFGGLDVDRVLIAELAALDSEDKAEFFHMFGQVGQHKARQVRVLDVVQIVDRLRARLEQVTTKRFLFDD